MESHLIKLNYKLNRKRIDIIEYKEHVIKIDKLNKLLK